MTSNIKNNYEYIDENSITHELICTICHKPFDDPRCFPCNHIFCHKCITQNIKENFISCSICQQSVSINDFKEVNYLIQKQLDELQVKCLICGEITLQRRNIYDHINKTCSKLNKYNISSDLTYMKNKEQDELYLPSSSSSFIFDPLKSILNELINQNKNLNKQINQFKKQNQQENDIYLKELKDIKIFLNQQNEQLNKNQIEIEQLKNENKQLKKQINEIDKQTQEHHRIHIIEHTNIHDQMNLYQKQLIEYKNHSQNQNTTISKLDQHQNLYQTDTKFKNRKFRQCGITIAGGNGYENDLDQLSYPNGIIIDDDQTIYIADSWNNRIVSWKNDAIKGEIVAGGNGEGKQMNQLNVPIDVIINKQNNSFIISDRDNRRVIQWSRQNNIEGQIIIENIDCYGLTMDKNGYIYVSDYVKNEVRRWKIGDKDEIVVAGGNGKGDGLNQLNYPTYIFVDEDYSLYISDRHNHRVMKWIKGAKEGIVVAGGNGKGNSLTQLSNPLGITVDQIGQIYVTDSDNHRVMRWSEEDKEGTIVIGGNGCGERLTQLYNPSVLTFDLIGNLYVTDCGNHRIQKFKIDFIR